MAALQQFFDAERKRRGWTMRQAATRSKMSVSKAYAIANGDDNVEFETFENIATAFGMTPAEMAAAMGKGPASGRNPKLSAVIALIESAFHLMTPQEWELREPVARQLFSVPTHAGPVTSAHNRRVTDPKRAANSPDRNPLSDLPFRQHPRHLPRLVFAGAV